MINTGITINCKQCNQPVTLTSDYALHLAQRKGIICTSCRQNGRHWTPAQYQEYLLTDHWQQTKARALKHYGRKCYLCGIECNPDIHHNDYSRLGGELMSDLIPLCRDHHQWLEALKQQ